ncbi:MAG: glycoside hydrolase family 2, partial [Acetatifactor sp.]|nr:glycoside hydrolase family 2 [Acetatifactor sp.]
AKGRGLESASLKLLVAPAAQRPGSCAAEDVSQNAACGGKLPDIIPVRKVELLTPEGSVLDADRRSLVIEARICPADAMDRDLEWKAVNQNGIPVSFAKVEPLDECHARVTAMGDGAFYVRCQSGRNPVRIISQLEFTAQGLGQAFLNPYTFISAGLFSETIGEVTNGNEKGIATSRDGVSGVIYRDLDFGEYGSDEITVPVFALSSDPHEIEIWQGEPEAEGSRLLLNALYQKPSQWNVYQEETWKLPCRLKGLTTIAFRLQGRKVHIKGFTFTYCEKAYGKLWGAECSRVYGDSFKVEDRAITGIGNNVTVVFENMDFGQDGADRVTLWGRSPLPHNTIHIHFTGDDGVMTSRVLEVPGIEDNNPRTFPLEPLKGKGILELIFLPGSNYDLEALQFWHCDKPGL